MNLFKNIIYVYSLFFGSSLLAQSNSFSVGWELWYPYQYHDEEQQLIGLDFDIFNAIIQQANITVNYTELPWKRHLHYIKTGEMAMAMGASYTEDRALYAFYSKPYRSETVKLYVKKGQAKKISLKKLSDLLSSPYMIGVEGGYFYGNEYQELIKNPKFQAQINEVIDIEENVQLLLKGHIDGFLVDPVTMTAFANKYKMRGEFEQHEIEIYSDNIYIMLSKKAMNVQTLERINNAISTLEENGKLTDIINNWSKFQSSTNGIKP